MFRREFAPLGRLCGKALNTAREWTIQLSTDMYLVDDPTDPPTPEASSERRDPSKVTARMLKIRELIELGEYPDRDALAESIVDKL